VVAVTGDGGFGFGLQELITAAQYGIGVTCVLFDNGAYGNVWRDQMRLFDGRLLASELRNPDWAALASSCGVSSSTANSPEELQRVLGKAVDSGEPALVVVPVDKREEVTPWTLLMPQPYA
jgi:acetolactate synthase-1/2/3 large subunit